MRLLLDTHILLWALVGDRRLPGPAKDLILDPQSVVCVSSASIWEIAIKHSLLQSAPGRIPMSAGQAAGYCRAAGYTLVAVTPDHAVAVEKLPPLHRDPFDRMLVAQALHEPLHLITHDPKVAAYNPAIVLV